MTIVMPRIFCTVAVTCALALCACAKKSDDKKSDDKGKDGVASKAPDKQPATPPAATKAKPEPVKAKPKPKPAKADPPKPGTFMTYNLGLVTAVGLDRQRLPEIIKAMKETRASVACLQEVWTEADYQTIAHELGGHYPHSYFSKTEDTSTLPGTPCNIAKALGVQRCATSKCQAEGKSLFQCMSDEALCKKEYDELTDDCKLCLAANTDAATSCAMGADQAKKWLTKGRNGLVLLSWNEIENPTFTEFETQLVKRGVITATVDGRTVQCTHLTATLDIVPYQKGTFDSWEAEHKGQVQAMDKAGEKVGGKDSTCRVLMGDMNTGPAVAGLAGEVAENYTEFKAAGWNTPWEKPECTFCADNELTGAKDNRWIDHVFFKGCKADAKIAYSRVFDQPITVKNEGKDVATRLSDHYGVLVETTGL